MDADTSGWTAGERREPSFIPPAHQHSDIYLQFYM